MFCHVTIVSNTQMQRLLVAAPKTRYAARSFASRPDLGTTRRERVPAPPEIRSEPGIPFDSLDHPYWKGKRMGNWLIAGLTLSLCVGTYFYAIRAVKQEDFSEFDDKGNLIKEDSLPVPQAATKN